MLNNERYIICLIFSLFHLCECGFTGLEEKLEWSTYQSFFRNCCSLQKITGRPDVIRLAS